MDDEYITEENDPTKAEKITEDVKITEENDDYAIIFENAGLMVLDDIYDKKGLMVLDDIYDNGKTVLSDFVNYDRVMNEKILDSLRKGGFRKGENKIG